MRDGNNNAVTDNTVTDNAVIDNAVSQDREHCWTPSTVGPSEKNIVQNYGKSLECASAVSSDVGFTCFYA